MKNEIPLADGRVRVRVEQTYPTTHKDGYILRYHLVWNLAHPDDPVLPGEVVHHRNEDCTDDRIDNLEKQSGQSEHWQLHASQIAQRRTRNALGRFT